MLHSSTLLKKKRKWKIPILHLSLILVSYNSTYWTTAVQGLWEERYTVIGFLLFLAVLKNVSCILSFSTYIFAVWVIINIFLYYLIISCFTSYNQFSSPTFHLSYLFAFLSLICRCWLLYSLSGKENIRVGCFLLCPEKVLQGLHTSWKSLKISVGAGSPLISVLTYSTQILKCLKGANTERSSR